MFFMQRSQNMIYLLSYLSLNYKKSFYALITFWFLVININHLNAQNSTGARHVQIGDARFWLVQLPAEKDYRLAVIGPKELYVGYSYLQNEATFLFDSNFPDFIENWQLEFFDGEADDFNEPIYIINGNWLPIGEKVAWTGELYKKSINDYKSIKYRLKVFDSKGHYAITKIQHIKLLSSSEVVNSNTLLTNFEEKTWVERMKGLNHIEKIHFGLKGGVIKIFAENLPPNGHFAVGSYVYPIGLSDKTEITRYVPAARTLQIPISLWDSNGEGIGETILEAFIEKDYFFMIALADLTIGQNGGSVQDTQAIEALTGEENFNGSIYNEARIAFYLKGKIKGKYLLTMQMDTGEDKISNIFKDIGRKESDKLFKRIDPDRYYPIYGDSSSITRDVDTQGKFYVKVEWDNSEVTWGNFNTGISGSELASYNRGLYGFNSDIRSNATTKYGDQFYQLNIFASTSETKAAHDEFLGTGSSLYYLNNQDVVLGSAKIAVEVREQDSNRIRERIVLDEGRDYNIDEFQGRITLQRPLRPTAGRQILSIVRDQPLDGDKVYLVIDYEYVPALTEDLSDNVTAGIRAKTWLSNNIGVGATHISEDRTANNFKKTAADLTLKFGSSSNFNAEYATSEAGQDIDYSTSDDGGLTFATSNFNNNNVDFTLMAGGSGYDNGVHENQILRQVELDTEGSYKITENGGYAFATVVVVAGKVTEVRDINFSRFRTNARMHLFSTSVTNLPSETDMHIITSNNITSGSALVLNGSVAVSDIFGDNFNGRFNGWYRSIEDNYDTITYNNDNQQNVNLGVEGTTKLGKNLTTSFRATQDTQVTDLTTTNQRLGANIKYNVTDRFSLATEYVFDNNAINNENTNQKATAGARLSLKASNNLHINATTQQVLDASGSAVDQVGKAQSGLGLDYKITKSISIKGEYFEGDNGSGYRFGGGYSGKNVNITTGYDGENLDDIGAGAAYEFNLNPNNTFYVNYDTESIDTENNQYTLGHRSKLTKKLEIYQEHRFKNTANSVDSGQSYGLNYNAADQWKVSFDTYLGNNNVQGKTQKEVNSNSLGSKYSKNGLEIINKIELRTEIDSVSNKRVQLHTANHFRVNLNDSLKMRGKIDYSNSEDQTSVDSPTITLARFGEIDIGVAYRPVNHDIFNMLLVYSYQYDLDPQQSFQVGNIEGSFLDEKSHILSFDALYELTSRIQLGGKLAYKQSEVSLNRSFNQSTSIGTTLAIGKLRYRIYKKWRVLLEYRTLSVSEAQDSRNGLLTAVEYHINNNFLVGLGFNSTQFNDDLTRQDFTSDGWFFSMVGKY